MQSHERALWYRMLWALWTKSFICPTSSLSCTTHTQTNEVEHRILCSECDRYGFTGNYHENGDEVWTIVRYWEEYYDLTVHNFAWALARLGEGKRVTTKYHYEYSDKRILKLIRKDGNTYIRQVLPNKQLVPIDLTYYEYMSTDWMVVEEDQWKYS